MNIQDPSSALQWIVAMAACKTLGELELVYGEAIGAHSRGTLGDSEFEEVRTAYFGLKAKLPAPEPPSPPPEQPKSKAWLWALAAGAGILILLSGRRKKR